MNRIRLLPEQVANQIAAGEVIERPASVVKELVENALDAQATRIMVEIQAGGRSLIRVSDDGIGMSRDDALLCLERHATSKIQRAEDLSGVTTMGFRGEALPSIASVSRFTLTTREREADNPEGTQVILNGGKMVDVKSAGTPPGTSVEVRQLFFNLPARRKFLRTEETETAHIQHYLTLAALAHSEVAFTFLRDSRTIWQLPPVGGSHEPEPRVAALRERLRAIYGGESQLLPVRFDTALYPRGEVLEDGEPVQPPSFPFTVWGLMGAPGVSRATREEQHLFVNRRPVENRALNYALLEGYHTALMKGRYPVCCLFLEIHPSLVDVNIHPAKREVKFHQENEIRRLVTQAIRQTLLDYHSQRTATVQPQSTPPLTAPVLSARADAISPAPADSSAGPAESNAATWAQPAQLALAGQHAPPLAVSTTPLFQPTTSPRPPLPGPAETPRLSSVVAPAPAYSPVPRPVTEMGTGPAASAPLLQVPLRLIGVIGKLYVVLESDRGLVLLDQHAAHERILFEQMLQRLEQGTVHSQRLLLPETVELAPRDAQFVRELLPTLNRLGVGLTEFGERTFLLDALPSLVQAHDARAFVLAVIDELKASGEGVNPLRLGEQTVAKTVCRHAVKANDPLDTPELEKLLADLRGCTMPYTCPHGRPTLIEMNYRELEKKFGRQQ